MHTEPLENWRRKKWEQTGISPRTSRICDNDKQAGGNKVRLFDFVIKRNLLRGGICHAENLGNLAILKKAEFRMKRVCKSRWLKCLLRLSKLHLWSSKKLGNLHIQRGMSTGSHNYTGSPPAEPKQIYILGIMVKTRHSQLGGEVGTKYPKQERRAHLQTMRCVLLVRCEYIF